MISWRTFIDYFFAPAVLICVCVVLAFWSRVFIWIKLYLVLPFRGRGEGSSITELLADAELDRLPQEQHSTLATDVRRLTAHGFDVATYLRAYTGKGWGVAAVMLNEREGASAQVMSIRHEFPDLPPLSAEFVTFCTEFCDDSAIVTTNCGIGVFRPDPLCESVLWPGMRDLDVLYRLHAARVTADRRGRQRKLPSRADAFAYGLSQDANTMWRQVEAGDYRFDAAGGTFRRTLKGSFVQHWKLLWPWKQRLVGRHDRKLRRALRELNMGAPEDYSPHPKDETVPALPYDSAPAS